MLHGTEVLPNEFPFMVAINEFKKTDWWSFNPRGSYCSAVLISKRHVLTAAHCVLIDAGLHETLCYQGYKRPEEYMEPEKLEVYIGTRCPKWGPCTPNRTVYEATSVIPYPGYEACGFGSENDIAIVELSKDADENDGIPICMPKENEQLATTLLAVGYGQDRKQIFTKSSIVVPY
ncbi:hypothetical protein OESDEN_11347 [Oesophagostomum dentatum]|uniref:Peptidase S1 domain-containing protein n=1 Tax=Oesophagostomum dentatum TaxID=61180 RepID=A0A0B1SV55_OESDE|nr:hypothetical protein OESDEN_11347 [Oesophagostomum dentatum]